MFEAKALKSQNIYALGILPRASLLPYKGEIVMQATKNKNHATVIKITTVALLTAIAAALQFIEVPIPIVPSFIKLDFSDIPELIGAFVYGPTAGVFIAFLKNLIHLPLSSSMYIGELSNFVLGASFALCAGLIYKKRQTLGGAAFAGVCASVIMGIVSLPLNYFVIYPLYYGVMGFPQEAILEMYRVILPSTKNILQALIIFNIPFTVVKGLICAAVSTPVYKPLHSFLTRRS